MNSYVWMEWLESGGAKGEEPPPFMKECWDWWQRARSSSNYDELTKAIQWLQGTAAEHLFAVGILDFPPQLRIHATGIHNVPEKENHFLSSALFVDLPWVSGERRCDHRITEHPKEPRGGVCVLKRRRPPHRCPAALMSSAKHLSR